MPVPSPPPSYSTPAYTDLATYLGQDSVNQARATQMIRWAEILCLSIVSPLPPGAELTVLTVAARGFVSPQSATPEVIGPYGTPSGQPSAGGVWLTRWDIRTLRRLNGNSGAFTIDTVPAGFTPQVPWWDASEPLLPGDLGWDQTP